MKDKTILLSLILILLVLPGCFNRNPSAASKEAEEVEAQQSQYAKAQPVPAFDWSLERDLVIQLYQIRNDKVSTHSVWRSEMGKVEGDCPSMGFGIPFDTSLTNPSMMDARYERGHTGTGAYVWVTGVVGQAEPNGIFASTNTSATWVMCVGDGGQVMPVYTESKVTVYPYPVSVNYETDRVVPSGSPSVTIHAAR